MTTPTPRPSVRCVEVAAALADTDRKAPLPYYPPAAADLRTVSELTLEAIKEWAEQRTADYGTAAWDDADVDGGIVVLEDWRAANARPVAPVEQAPPPAPVVWPDEPPAPADPWGAAVTGDERLAVVNAATSISWCDAALAAFPVRGTPGAGKYALQTEVVERLRRVRADLVGLRELLPLLRSGVGQAQARRDLDELDARRRPVVTDGVRGVARQLRARLEAAERETEILDAAPRLDDAGALDDGDTWDEEVEEEKIETPSPSAAQPPTDPPPSVSLAELAAALGVDPLVAPTPRFLLDRAAHVAGGYEAGAAEADALRAKLAEAEAEVARVAKEQADALDDAEADRKAINDLTASLHALAEVKAKADAEARAEAEKLRAQINALSAERDRLQREAYELRARIAEAAFVPVEPIIEWRADGEGAENLVRVQMRVEEVQIARVERIDRDRWSWKVTDMGAGAGSGFAPSSARAALIAEAVAGVEVTR